MYARAWVVSRLGQRTRRNEFCIKNDGFTAPLFFHRPGRACGASEPRLRHHNHALLQETLLQTMHVTRLLRKNVLGRCLIITCDELQTSLGFVTNDNIYGTDYDPFLGHVQPRPASS